MLRRRLFGFSLLGLALSGCGGVGSGLLATVPPPVEFAGSRFGGNLELPRAGTYTGTLVVERVTYVYDLPSDSDPDGEWRTTEATALAEPQAATAAVNTDGTIELRSAGETTLFSGTLRVDPATEEEDGSTTASLTAFDGSSALYPYSLLGDGRLSITAHTRSRGSRTRLTFDQYSFVFDRSE